MWHSTRMVLKWTDTMFKLHCTLLHQQTMIPNYVALHWNGTQMDWYHVKTTWHSITLVLTTRHSNKPHGTPLPCHTYYPALHQIIWHLPPLIMNY